MPQYFYRYLRKRHRNVKKCKTYIFETSESILASPHNIFKWTVQRHYYISLIYRLQCCVYILTFKLAL